ncbi:MAG TPA: hypothetical protein VE621_03810 [Bryobacteraceae bacterium]|nr:hypothetical protein [Bryobacteraceae bacterium]
MKHIICLMLIGAASLYGAETKVRLQDTPAAVQKTVQAETKNATMVGITKEVEKGKTVYELETKVDGKARDLLIRSDGSVLSVEQEVTLDSIPEGARAAITKRAAGGSVKKVETVKENGNVAYEAELVVKGKPTEVKVAADGTPVK